MDESVTDAMKDVAAEVRRESSLVQREAKARRDLADYCLGRVDAGRDGSICAEGTVVFSEAGARRHIVDYGVEAEDEASEIDLCWRDYCTQIVDNDVELGASEV